MRLYYSPTSPYARKVRAVAIEKRLADSIRMIETSPLENPQELHRANPLGKVPTLVLADGRAVFDSPVICGYLDEIGSGPILVPPAPDDRLAVLTRQALADGVMDVAFSLVMERRRPSAEQSAAWCTRWIAAIERGVATMVATPRPSAVDLGDLSCACALSYLDFRLPRIDWRSINPPLGPWLAVMEQRRSLAETAPA